MDGTEGEEVVETEGGVKRIVELEELHGAVRADCRRQSSESTSGARS
jgi:hypothetical protein